MNKVYSSPSGDGHVNLAADQYILSQYRSGAYSGVTLYFYVNSNAVIIGRNQNAWRECNTERMGEDGVQLVRRHTGGGAVYHDSGNLNFSFITNEKLYDKQRFNSVIINAVARLGLKAEANGRNDITVEGRKFSGCAYALSGVARAMHGTVLVNTDLTRLSGYLNPSAKKLAAKGVTSVRSRVINLSELTEVSVERMRELITEEFVREFGPAEPLILDSAAQEAIGRLTEEQSSWEWMFGRSPEFDWQLDSRFSFGGVQLLVSVKNGLIASARTYTDSMEVGLPEEVSSLLTGVRFGKEEIAAALEKGGPACREISAYIARSALIERARQRLHSIPELGLKEEKTKAFIKEFISSHTSLELHDEGAFIYAVHREGDLPALCVRADFDAVPCGDSAVHLCGHDGHTAALLGLGLMLEGTSLGRTVVLLFQPAEETGRGAPLCAPLFKKENISAVIGAHNIPGRPFSVLLRPGVFTCASCGLELRLTGRPTHAAYPENGVDPTEALARLALEIPEKAKSLSEEYGCMTLATVVGLRAGERAFGVAASEAALWVTLRSESAEAFSSLRAFAVSRADELSDSHGLILSVTEEDPFPATVNDPGLYERLLSVCKKRMLPYYILEEPFRWSEDFGHYSAFAPALFFGVGSGVDTAPLHTSGYEYPSGLASSVSELLFTVVTDL